MWSRVQCGASLPLRTIVFRSHGTWPNIPSLKNGLAQSNCRYDIPSLSLLVFPVAIVGQVGEGGREMSWGGETERGEGDTARGGGGGEFPHV